jgi:hypothetical protein
VSRDVGHRIRVKAQLTVLTLAVALVGCERPSYTIADFDAVELGMTMNELTTIVGAPTRPAGRGVVKYEYDLVDRSQFVVFLDSSQGSIIDDLSTWTIFAFGQRSGTNWLSFKQLGYD